MKNPFLFAALFLLSLTACNRYYTSNDFDKKTKSHKTIAILPFQMKMTGRIPKELTEEQIQAIEEAESKAFQSSFIHQVLAQGNRGKRYLRVDIQDAETTNGVLEKNGIDIRGSWTADPTEMATMLGVDAVVRSKVVKERFLSDLESIGVDILGTVLNTIFRNPIWFGGGNLNKTATVNVGVSLLDGDNATILFSTDQDMDVDWSLPANRAIDNICRRVARRVPYSVKK